MKILSGLLVCSLLGAAVYAPAAEPSKESEREQQQLVAVTKEVQSQVTAIADNQAKIDSKMATIAEALRLAKIYASRGGK